MGLHEKADVIERTNPLIEGMHSQSLAQRHQAQFIASIELTTPILVTSLITHLLDSDLCASVASFPGSPTTHLNLENEIKIGAAQ